MSFNKNSTKRRATEMKVENSIREKSLKVERIRTRLELNKTEIKRLQIENAELEIKLEVEVIRNEKLYLKVLNREGKLSNLCPACLLEHTESPPDECWVKIFNTKDKKEYTRFDNYLQKNHWGTFKVD